MNKNTDKINIQRLSFLFARKGVNHVVMSPGSRNTPLIVAFNREQRIRKDIIVDERSAAYYALGIAQRTKSPVALICTSGTALLNYSPAVAEAYYQNIPLIVVSADRPEAWVDQDDSQVIRQRGVLDNHIKKFFQINIEQTDKESVWCLNRTLNEAVNIATAGRKGPVHINMPISEPLFNEADNIEDDTRIIQSISPIDYDMSCFDQFFELLHDKKVMVIASINDYNKALGEALSELSNHPNFVILSESVANIPFYENDNIVRCIDRTLSCRSKDHKDDYMPDIIITFGGPVISKLLKQTIKEVDSIDHWAVTVDDVAPDTYTHLKYHFKISPSQWFHALQSYIKNKPLSDCGYARLWSNANSIGRQLHKQFTDTVDWSDLKAMDIVSRYIPKGSNLQLSNGTSIRYRQLFDNINTVAEYCNRGTSGIDGSLSTAAGSASVFDGITTLIIGDLSFLYDVNGLWNRNLSLRLKIIILNNGGGGIFRFMKGPSSLPELTPCIETPQNIDIESVAKAYGIDYYKASDAMELTDVISRFYENQGCAILNIITPKETNGEILRDYFKYLRNNN